MRAAPSVLWEKVSRERNTSRHANLPFCLIGIEAGLATRYVPRELAPLGDDVKQVAPTHAKPFRQGHKHDFRNAHAVAEAVKRPTTRFVPAKTDEQLGSCKHCTGFGFAYLVREDTVERNRQGGHRGQPAGGVRGDQGGEGPQLGVVPLDRALHDGRGGMPPAADP